LGVATRFAQGSHFHSFPSFHSCPAVPIASLVLVPLLAGFFLNNYHEFFFPRFLLYVVPLLLVLTAAGLARLFHLGWAGRAAALGLLLLPAASWAAYLGQHYAAPGEAALAEDWRPLASRLGPHFRPGDAAIYGRGWMPGYLHAYLPPYPEPAYYLGHFTPEALGAELEAIAARHSRVWLLDYQIDQFDQRNAAGRWLGDSGALAYAEWFGQSHAALFIPAQHLPEAGAALTAEFENGLQLRWVPISVELRAGDAAGLALTWTAPAGARLDRFTVFLHGLAVDGTLVFGRDSEPVNGLKPADGWAPGSQVREWRGALLPPGLPPGRYMLNVGLYETLTQKPVLTRDGRPAVPAGEIKVR
jgi:hypothetical protein